MSDVLFDFQKEIVEGIVNRFATVGKFYRDLAPDAESDRQKIREQDGAVVLQAPTGSGKTKMAIEAMARASCSQPILWFWFAPFAGLIEQARDAIEAEAPQLTLLDLGADRRADAPLAGGVFVTTWASVAARSAQSRIARTSGDSGLSLDEVVAVARDNRALIGCVVDEAHHGFHRAGEARRFFTKVLRPDFTLMMTATPRDRDALDFERDTGYRIGDPREWASVSRYDGVAAGLLKSGVRVVRFIARDGDEERLIDFEHLALDECAAQHRRIGERLRESGIDLTPLMLVQVPNGTRAQESARSYLIERLGFTEEAVRVHTADEPDPDLIALAHDPKVEVLLFKMAVGLGFDAPRAFTLAALRGARDPAFGIQVIGRILRVHKLLRGHEGLPPSLDYGYVFLANSASQEGLLSAGVEINALTTRAPEIGTQTVVTVLAGEKRVQVGRSGTPLELIVGAEGTRTQEVGIEGEGSGGDGAAVSPEPLEVFGDAAQSALALAGGRGDAPTGTGPQTGIQLDAIHDDTYCYPRRPPVPGELLSEVLPPPPADIETRLIDYVDFSADVLKDSYRRGAAVRKRESDVFSRPGEDEEGKDIWARLEPAAVAERANQLRLALEEADQRALVVGLLERFSRALRDAGFEVPEDEETLNRQLDLVLARNPRLLRDAYRRVRHTQVELTPVPLPGVLKNEMPLAPAERNAYGVFPPTLGPNDETEIARMLDSDHRVLWWHRNPPRSPGVGLYEWDEGRGYFPDFVVAIEGRDTKDHIALLEVKGAHLVGAETEVQKAGAVHPRYGRVLMVGRERGSSTFNYLREGNGRLSSDGVFDLARLRWAD